MSEKLLVFGGSGLVGSRFIELSGSTFQINAPDLNEVDILDAEAVKRTVGEFNPQSVINLAAFTNVQGAQKEKDDKEGSCYRLNAIGANNVASACSQYGVYLVHISTDYVFNGRKADAPYTEEDKPDPINWYGQTKYFGEQFVLESGCEAAIVRISMPFSAHHKLKNDVARLFLEELRAGRKINVVKDQAITPTNVDCIARALVVILGKKPSTILHVSSTNTTTPLGFATTIAQVFGLDTALIKPISFDKYNEGQLAPILHYSWLDSSRFVRDFGSSILHTVEEGVELFKKMIDESGLN